MRAGRLIQRITIEKPTAVTGQSGGTKKTWAPHLVDIAAGRRNPSGNERRATSHGGEVAEARVEFEIRYRPGITEQMRVKHKGKFFNIKHVNNVNEENDRLIPTCDTGVNHG
jgi:SPP1 family predicted phage head-tail adaptor